jgi:tripartite-type tricarboxylate transporter receptor subunit TctC
MTRQTHTLNAVAFVVAFGALYLLNAVGGKAQGDPVADFYKGKTISLYIGTTPGGGYDTYARIVARFMGAHIPGGPLIVPRNMPGAGGRVAAAYVYNVVAKDGLSLEASDQTLALQQALDYHKLQYDMAKFNWIGSPDSDNKIVNTWYTSGINTIEDAKKREVVMGAVGDGPSSQYLRAMNALIGTKFRIVSSYPGANEINLAMERGEIDGRGSGSWAIWKARPDWLSRIKVLVQVGVAKSPDLPNVPLLMDLATNAEDRAVLRLLSSPSAIGHPILTTPDTPTERVKALRDAFNATMKDPAFLAAAKKAKLEIDPVLGEHLQSIVQDILSAPSNVRSRLASILVGH